MNTNVTNSTGLREEIAALESRLNALGDDSAYEKALIRRYEELLTERRERLQRATNDPLR
jgi:hypothetical protein